jgi:hypothetical protein
MRKLIRVLPFAVVIMTGCESTQWNWLKKSNGDIGAKPGASPDVVGLVAYLNANAGRIQTVRVDDMSIDATMGNQSIALQGVLLAEKPRQAQDAPNFRMKASFFGKNEVDIGSNANEFWFWALRNPDPYQYFCRYQDLRSGRVDQLPLPIQPEWVLEAFGLGPYGPADKYKLEVDGKKVIRLVERTTSPQGKPLRKVIVMNPKEVAPPTPQVTAYLLIDETTNKEICSVHILTTTLDRAGAILPHKMDIRMPTQKMSMLMKMDRVTINGSIVPTAFVREPMNGIEPFNLATKQIEPWGAQRTQGFGKN